MQIHQLNLRAHRILQQLLELKIRRIVPITEIETAERDSGAFAPYAAGAFWGEAAEWVDFRFRAVIPPEFADKTVLRIRTGRDAEWAAVNPQMEAYVDGRATQAFDGNHTTLLLPTEPGRAFDVLLRAYCPLASESQVPPVLIPTLEEVSSGVEQLIYDFQVALDTAEMMPEGQRDREVTLEILSRAIDLLDLRRPHSAAFDASVQAAREYMREHFYQPSESLPVPAWADCVGHTHIDVAWLWDLYQTRHKAVRSFSTVLQLMQQYPEYIFMSSTPALYQMVKEDDPELYGRIRQAIADGRWEPEGGMWVEADCNLSSGESLIRQFLQGQKFFEKEFGRRSEILWLPDVFGYSVALPQIMRLCGIRYFMTTKLSWSEYNKLPYDTFTWRGMDGSEVLTHFSPSREYGDKLQVRPGWNRDSFTTYNAMLTPSQMKGGWERFQQKAIDNEFLVTYGYGDGGGGPTDWMLENGRRMKGALPGLPAARQMFPSQFFHRLEQRMQGEKRLPRWSGELYLEYHRGTYTSQGKNKRNNRKAELLLREVELWSAKAAREVSGFQYPDLEAIWRTVLTLQFHDILPGSSIHKVYEDSDRMYAQAFERLNALKAQAKAALAAGRAGDVLCFNSLSCVRDDIVWFDAPADVTFLRDASGALYPVQQVEGKACAFARGLKPMATTPFWFVREAPCAQETAMLEGKRFETPFFTGDFDDAMRIIRLVDRDCGRQIAREPLNSLVCYENKPHNYDAWDINIYYDRRSFPVDQVKDAQLIANGPVLALLRVHYTYMDSTLTQDILFYHDIKRIDFRTEADWHEKQTLLKAHFPVDVFYTEATFDVQYGNIKRPVHRNTSWDAARFEVCAHKWADVGEDDYGVALMNDCKYGYSVSEEDLALSLIKCSIAPDPEADQGHHSFVYSLAPHCGGWRQVNLPAQAYALNIPVETAPGGGEALQDAGFAVDAPNVIVEAVKQAEDGSDVILRLYECFGRRSHVTLRCPDALQSAEICNALEEKLTDADFAGSDLRFEIRPYEIKTFRLKM